MGARPERAGGNEGSELKPNIISCSASISACEKGAKWERTVELLGQMREFVLKPDMFSDSAAMSACRKRDKWDRTFELLKKMRERGLKPDVISCSAALLARYKCGRIDTRSATSATNCEKGGGSSAPLSS